MEWMLWQWCVYTVVQLIVAFAYYVIPAVNWYSQKHSESIGIRFIPSDFSDGFLFRAFVVACGTHHLTHPVFMYFGWFWPIILVDSVMAGVSILAAYRKILVEYIKRRKET